MGSSCIVCALKVSVDFRSFHTDFVISCRLECQKLVSGTKHQHVSRAFVDCVLGAKKATIFSFFLLGIALLLNQL
jgi:hypothetical protein